MSPIAICALVAVAGAVLVSSASGWPTHADVSVGESVEVLGRGFQDGRELGFDDEE